jgi:hypothetical protein
MESNRTFSTAQKKNFSTEREVIMYLQSKVTSNDDVKKAVGSNDGGETIVTLVRGCLETQAKEALAQKSAGGQLQNSKCGRPSESQAISQVGGSQPGITQKKLPEFTANAENSAKWARGGGWLVVNIKAKYLTQGDVGQEGWVCFHSAPLEELEKAELEFITHPIPLKTKILNAD